jgi:hypothetical protein
LADLRKPHKFSRRIIGDEAGGYVHLVRVNHFDEDRGSIGQAEQDKVGKTVQAPLSEFMCLQIVMGFPLPHEKNAFF